MLTAVLERPNMVLKAYTCLEGIGQVLTELRLFQRRVLGINTPKPHIPTLTRCTTRPNRYTPLDIPLKNSFQKKLGQSEQ